MTECNNLNAISVLIVSMHATKKVMCLVLWRKCLVNTGLYSHFNTYSMLMVLAVMSTWHFITSQDTEMGVVRSPDGLLTTYVRLQLSCPPALFIL